jgi:hypothetical protein
MRAIKCSTLAIAILAVLATFAVFVPPAHRASAASSPYLSIQGDSSSGYTVVGQGFTPGATVYLGAYQSVNGQWQSVSGDSVTAAQCFVALYPYVHCTNNAAPGTFTYKLPGTLNVGICSPVSIFAYDYTRGWSNELQLRPSWCWLH